MSEKPAGVDAFQSGAPHISFFVPGAPAPQGSKRHVGHGILVESSKQVKPWRSDVKTAAWVTMSNSGLTPFDGPVTASLEFVMPRPKSAPKRTTPPAVKRPDIDKLIRAVLDAVKDVVWLDDSQVTVLHSRKRLAEIGETPGLYMTVHDRKGG